MFYASEDYRESSDIALDINLGTDKLVLSVVSILKNVVRLGNVMHSSLFELGEILQILPQS